MNSQDTEKRAIAPHVEKRSRLWLCCLTPEQRSRTCGYWYTVTSEAMPLTAFRTRYALERWLWLRRLRLTAELPEALGEHASMAISGQYRRATHGDKYAFGQLVPTATIKALDNGDYTLCHITTDEDGIKTEHFLNCNVPGRPVFDYRTAQDEEDGRFADHIGDATKMVPSPEAE